MESCWAATALNGVDRRALQRSARLGREVLERARRRAVSWRPQGHPRATGGPGPQRLPAAEKEERLPTLSASFRTMAEFMDYTSSQCGKYYSSVLEEGGATHVYRYHRRKLPEQHMYEDTGCGQRKDWQKASFGPGNIYQTSESTYEASELAEDTAKDLYIEVYPGTYSVTVGSNASSTKKTHVVAIDSGQSVDLVFPV